MANQSTSLEEIDFASIWANEPFAFGAMARDAHPTAASMTTREVDLASAGTVNIFYNSCKSPSSQNAIY
jgi:hypothetical protein